MSSTPQPAAQIASPAGGLVPQPSTMIYWRCMPKKKESEFEKLARLIKEEGDDIRSDVRDQISGVHVEIGGLHKEMHDGFATITAASTSSYRRSSMNTLGGSKNWKPPSSQNKVQFQ
jgi:hypothetical protein